MFAIYKRELKSYFHSFIGLLFIAVTLFFVGLYYTVYNLVYGYPYFSYAISSVIFAFLLSMPILCMRVMSEERKNKTDQLILTAPVSVGQIIMGKFLALLTVLAIPTLIICIYPLVLSSFGSVPMGDAYMAILAFFLYGMTSIAICLWVSSLTESQVIAAVLGFGMLFLGYMMSGIISVISTSENIITKVLGSYDMYTPFAYLLNGTLEVTSIVYFLSLTVLALFLAVQSVQKRRYSISTKSLSFGAYSSGMIVIAVIITVVVNVMVGQLPTSWTSLDLTSEKLYSLTDQTKSFLETLDEDVTIYVIVNEDNADTTVSQTLKRYEEFSSHITVEYVDPTVNPLFHTQYTSSSISSHSLIVVSETRSQVIDYSELYVSEFDYSTYSYSTTGYDAEGQITSALDYVTSDEIPKAYILTGHSEYTLSSNFTEALSKENVETETINLMDYDEVPEDAACLLILAPSSDLSTDDKDKVIAYLERGGKVITTTMYTEKELTNYEELLAYMGITLVDGMVVEGSSSYYYQSPFYLLPEIKYCDYTTGVYGSYYVFAPYGQGLQLSSDDDSIEYTEILKTSSASYSKVDLMNATDYIKSDEDVDGPFVLGVEAVKTLEVATEATEADTDEVDEEAEDTDEEAEEDTQETAVETIEATMVVYSCSELFTDSASQMVGGANQVLFTNTVSRFVDHEVSTSIPVKSYEVSYLTLTQANIFKIAAVVMGVLPVGCLIVGFVIWFKRRKK